MFCYHCGHRLPSEARFCSSCGTRVAGAEVEGPAQAPVPEPEPSVAAEPVVFDEGAVEPVEASPAAEPVTPGTQSVWRRGAPPAPAAAPASSVPPAPPSLPPLPPPPVYAPPSPPQAAPSLPLPPLHLGALAGFGAAIVATLLAWLRVSNGLRSEAVNGWNSEAQFRLADWLSLDAPVDALLVLVIAGLGIYLLLGRVLGSNVPVLPYVVAACGVALVFIGVLNWVYIDSEGNRVVSPDLSVGFGIYLLIIGGAVAAFCGYRDAQIERASRYEEQAA